MEGKTLHWGQEPLMTVPTVKCLTVSQPEWPPLITQGLREPMPSSIFLLPSLRDHFTKRLDFPPTAKSPGPLLPLSPPSSHPKLFHPLLSSKSAQLRSRFTISSYSFSLAPFLLLSKPLSFLLSLFLPIFPLYPTLPLFSFSVPDQAGAHICLGHRHLIQSRVPRNTPPPPAHQTHPGHPCWD